MRDLPKNFATAAALVLFAIHASAQLSPSLPATYSEGIQPSDGGGTLQNFTPGTIGGAFNGVTTSATAGGGSDPFVSAEASGSTNPPGRTVIFGSASASVDYFFEVTGPAGNAPVPINITGSLSTFAETDGQMVPLAGAEAIAEILTGAQIFTFWAAENPPIQNAPSSVSMNSMLDFNSNQVYEVNLEAIAGVGNLTSPSPTAISGTAEASIDPTFAIDPSFLINNPGFSLEFSSGVGGPPPMSPVPESSDWGLAAGILAAIVAGVRLARVHLQATAA